MQKTVANEAGDKGAKVTDYSAGHTFGELSLMYNTPRAATLVATSACKLLAMERVIFRSIVMGSIVARREKSEAMLKASALFAALDNNTRAAIADVCSPASFDAGAPLLEASAAPRLLFLSKGTVQAGGATYSAEGEFFGAREVLRRAPPAADVVAATECECFAIDAADVKR